MKRFLNPVNFLLGMAVIALCGALTYVIVYGDGSAKTAPGTSIATAPPTPLVARPQTTSGVLPINNVDLSTGNPVGPNSITKTHKGYTIGFCCDQSPAWSGWNLMSETEKDALVTRFAP